MQTKRLQIAALAAIVVLLIAGLLWRRSSGNPHTVMLTWQAAPANGEYAIVGYNVYRSTGAGRGHERIAARVPESSYQDRHVRSGSTYHYAVTSVDQTGRESRLSSEVAVTVP